MNHVSENVSLQHYCLNLNLATLFWTPRRAQAQSLRPARGAARFRTRCAPKAGLWPGAGRGAARFRTGAPPKLALWPGGAVLPIFGPRRALKAGIWRWASPQAARVQLWSRHASIAGLCALCGWLGQKVTT